MKNERLIRIITAALILILSMSLFACARVNEPPNAGNTPEEVSPPEDETPGGADIPGTIKPAETRPEETVSDATPEEISREQAAFSEFMDRQFKEAIESSYLACHIYYIDPEAAGIDISDMDPSFGIANDESDFYEMRAYYDDLKTEFSQFNRALLTPEQQVEYDAFQWEITLSIIMNDEKFDFYEQMFAPPNSLDANLVSYLSTWDIRHERDARDTVALINSIPDYVDSAIQYARTQQEKELLMTDFDVVIEACRDVLDIGIDSSVLKHLTDEIDELDLDAALKEEYKNQISEAFENSYLPSFQKIIDAMEDMRSGYNNTEGFAYFPYGSEYYEYQLMYATGTMDSTINIDAYLEEKSAQLMDELMKMYIVNANEIHDYYEGSGPKSGFNSYIDILDANKEALLVDHPEVKNLEYNIEDADPEEKLDEKNIAAYFLVPPLDGERLQQMRVNPESREIDSLDTYITVSHEGFPGHMYHYAYMYENIESPYIKTLGVDAFVEGYAVYAEIESMNYLDIKPAYKDITRISTIMSYIDYSLADIGINYYGWDVYDTLSFFEDSGYGVDQETAQEIFDYLRCSPTTYAPYGYGYIRISDIRENAEDKLGDKFNLLDFNTALLKPGPVPFNIIEDYIDEYIEAAE